MSLKSRLDRATGSRSGGHETWFEDMTNNDVFTSPDHPDIILTAAQLDARQHPSTLIVVTYRPRTEYPAPAADF